MRGHWVCCPDEGLMKGRRCSTYFFSAAIQLTTMFIGFVLGTAHLAVDQERLPVGGDVVVDDARRFPIEQDRWRRPHRSSWSRLTGTAISR